MFFTTCASAVSTTSRGWSVFSAAPSRKRRPEPVRHRRDPVLRHQPVQSLRGQRPPALIHEHRVLPAAQLPRRFENLTCPTAQRHPMLPRRLRPACGNRPHARALIHLVPHRTTDLGAPRRSQHHELERQRIHAARLRCPHLPDGRSDLAVRQSPIMRDRSSGRRGRVRSSAICPRSNAERRLGRPECKENATDCNVVMTVRSV